jgi:malate/lactate dehydrogenase
VLGTQGVERILEMELNDEEKAMLKVSADAVQSVVGILGY